MKLTNSFFYIKQTMLEQANKIQKLQRVITTRKFGV